MCAASESPTSDGDAAVAALGARSSVGRMLNALDARRKLMGVGRGARRLRRRRGRRQLRRCSEVKTIATTQRARFTATPPSRRTRPQLSVGRVLNAPDARRQVVAGVGRGARRLRRRRGRRQLRRCSEVKTLATTLRARFTATPPSRFRCACALLSNDRAHSRRLHRVVGRGAQRAVPRGATRRLREVEGVRRSPPGATFSVARTPRPLKA